MTITSTNITTRWIAESGPGGSAGGSGQNGGAVVAATTSITKTEEVKEGEDSMRNLLAIGFCIALFGYSKIRLCSSF